MTYKTVEGKELAISVCPKTAHIIVHFVGGGAVPQELSGVYTSKALAEMAVKTYLLKNKDKQEARAEKKKANKELEATIKENLNKKED